MQWLAAELAYGRTEHEAWLRSSARPLIQQERRQIFTEEAIGQMPGFDLEDEASWEAEVQAQLDLFDRCGSRQRMLCSRSICSACCIHEDCAGWTQHIQSFEAEPGGESVIAAVSFSIEPRCSEQLCTLQVPLA